MRLPRSARISRSSSVSRSRPSNAAVPATDAVRGNRPSSDVAVNDFPEPLSPTMASVSPGATSNDTAETGSMRPFGVSIATLEIAHRKAGRTLVGCHDEAGQEPRAEILVRGRSRSPSADRRGRAAHRTSRLIARIVTVSSRHGQSSSSGAWSIVARAPRIIRPQDGVGGTVPSPRNDSPLSITIAAASVSENCTSSGPAIFGRIVRDRMRGVVAPSARTAST